MKRIIRFLFIYLFSFYGFATSPTLINDPVTIPVGSETGTHVENQVFLTGANMQTSADIEFNVLASHMATGMTDINQSSGTPIYLGEVNVYSKEIRDKRIDINDFGGTYRKIDCSLIKKQSGESDVLSHESFSLTVPEQGFDCELVNDGSGYKVTMKALSIVAIDSYTGPQAKISFQLGDNDGLVASKLHRVKSMVMVNDTYNPSSDTDRDIFTKNNSQNSAINDHLVVTETITKAQSALLFLFEFDLDQMRSDSINDIADTAFSGNEIELTWEYDGL